MDVDTNMDTDMDMDMDIFERKIVDIGSLHYWANLILE
jgi:hypothetical protein